MLLFARCATLAAHAASEDLMLMAEEELLLVPEVARRVRVSEETVRRWLRSGALRGFQLATGRGGWRIPATEVDRLLTGGRQLTLPDEGRPKRAA
jgi:excisionase family DNA binding protein